MRRILTALALTASLAVAGCQNPDGSTDWGNTVALGAGVGIAAGLLAGAANDNGHHRHYDRGGYYDRGYGYRGSSRGYSGRGGGYGHRGGRW